MGLQTVTNGQLIETGQTVPSGLAIGSFSPHRKLINWMVPNRGMVEMYINPQSLTIVERKITKETRTKGGYVVQYWGEALPEIDIAGTTGSGGIEGINVLRDIYRQEQVGFVDVVSQLNNNFLGNLFQSTLGTIQDLSNNPLANPIAGVVTALKNPDQFFSDVVSTVGNVANVFDSIGRAINTNQQLLPTLAALATSVEMYYDSKIYRGFFKEFRVDEKAEESGIFRYSMKFTVTRQTGQRLNSYPWNRSVNYGPANSDVAPLSFGALSIANGANSQATLAQPNTPVIGVSRRSLLTGI